MRFPGGKTKAVTLSYDDGCDADAKLIDIINRHHMKCTFNLNCDILQNGASLLSCLQFIQANPHCTAGKPCNKFLCKY